MTGKATKTVATKNPGTDKKPPRIDAARYEAMKAAILAVIPCDAEGVTFASLPKLVGPRLPGDVFAGASIPWYVATVKLDLEARGLIERLPGKPPQRLRRID
jgi:hypothetical protein